MPRSGLLEVLDVLQPLVYGLLAVMAFVHWRRHSGRASAWLAASFGVLGVAVVAGPLAPESSNDALAVGVRKAQVALVVLFPYCLYQFAAAFVRPVAWVRAAATFLTVVLALGAVLLPDFPDEGEPRPAWFEIYVVVLLTQWVVLTGIVAVRLWRAGRGQPTVARRRMRTMSLGAAGLAMALVVAGESSPESSSAEALVAVLAVGAAPLMLVGFAPPQFLRVLWRRNEESALKEARHSLMRAETAAEVARSLLTHARARVGASAAVLGDADGRIVASDGIDEEEARRLIEPPVDALSTVDERPSEALVKIPVGSGRLTVVAGRFTPFFGRDELSALDGLAALADLALSRSELLESQRRLAEIVESSDDAIISKTLDGTITSWNRGAERIYGYSPEEAIGNSITILVPQQLEDEVSGFLKKVRDGDSIEHFQSTRQTKDGRMIDVSLTISPIRNPDGQVVGASTIARDVTERTQIERERELAREEADRANQAKSEFLSRMSHELRTPLNAILGFAQLLELDELQDRQAESVKHILKGGRHLLQLIDEVLDIARIEAGEMRLSLEPVDAAEVSEDSIALVGTLATRRGIRIDVDLGDHGSRWVLADRQRLKQVLLNLLSNAIKYNHEGGLVRVGLESRADDRLAIVVSDSGPGIAREQQKLLFEPFERLGAEGGSVEGAGLGLALSKRLMEAMGGSLEADSEPGRGTTMSIELQRVGPSANEDPEAATAASQQLTGRTVLYIEDNLANLQLVERLLERFSDVRLLSAMQGNLGLELARENRPDLVLLDLHLPDIRGHEVLLRLKAEPTMRDAAVIVVTADASKGEERRMLAAGAHAYLTKPLDVQQFLAVIQEALDEGVTPTTT